MSNTVNCYLCGNEIADSESFNADSFTNDGGCFCYTCYKREVSSGLHIMEVLSE
jgi:hypothetical protein